MPLVFWNFLNCRVEQHTSNLEVGSGPVQMLSWTCTLGIQTFLPLSILGSIIRAPLLSHAPGACCWCALGNVFSSSMSTCPAACSAACVPDGLACGCEQCDGDNLGAGCHLHLHKAHCLQSTQGLRAVLVGHHQWHFFSCITFAPCLSCHKLEWARLGAWALRLRNGSILEVDAAFVLHCLSLVTGRRVVFVFVYIVVAYVCWLLVKYYQVPPITSPI